MSWFRVRTKARKKDLQPRRLHIEELEGRIATGVTWSPDLGIDVTGIMSYGAGGIVVAGQWVTFSIVGSGEDWDAWAAGGGSTGQEQDTVVFTWSSSSGTCQILDGGKMASCQIGSAGSPAIVDILLDADDVGAMPGGDEGSRDDPAVHFGSQIYGIWVYIGLKSSGTMDPDHTLSFPGSPPGRELGETTSYFGDTGIFSKVELTGNIFHPTVPDGTGRFEWRQVADSRSCDLRRNGSVGNYGKFTGADAESPFDQYQTHETVNSKVFMLDSPGTFNLGIGTQEVSIDYRSFTTWVEFNGVKASYDYKWSVTVTRRDTGAGLWDNPNIVVREGHDNARPAGSPPPLNTPGITEYPVDCSTQPFIG